MSIPIVRGRIFTSGDGAAAPNAIVINQSLARQFFPNEDPIGRVLSVQWGKDPYHIIGVVGDVHQHSLADEVKPEVFICDLQHPTGPVYLVARTHGSPSLLARAIQAEVHSLNKDIPISDVKTMDDYVAASVSAPKFNTILLGGFSGPALLQAAVGIFGVISYSTAQRTKEIGLRLALGASAGSVKRLVVAQGMGATGIGIAIGLIGALGITRVLRTMLFNAAVTDPVTFAAVAGLLAAEAFTAVYIPALRASRVDPMESLRHE
jgi:putative ABC transport system permease protein